VSIRRKLFYAFIGVVAVPLAIAAALARHYLVWEQSVLDQRYVGEVRAAFTRMNAAAERRVEALQKDVRQAAVDYDELGDEHVEIRVILPRVGDAHVDVPLEDGLESGPRLQPPKSPSFGVATAMPAVVRALRQQHPEILGVKLRDAHRVVYSDLSSDVDPVKEWPPGAPAKPGMLVPLAGGRRFSVERLPSGGELTVEIDPRLVVAPERVLGSGWAFYVKAPPPQPWHAPYELWYHGGEREPLERAVAQPMAALGAELPGEGELASVRDQEWVRWRVYGALSSENDVHHYTAGARLVAMVREDEIYAPLTWFRVEVYGALFASLLVAAWLAYFLSGRFTGAVDRIRSGVEALSRGEWAQLDKLSEDELGGGLVESVNHMAMALAERTRKDEIEGWRRMVRVLSHEINNTLGPVRSVAVTVRDQVVGRLNPCADRREGCNDAADAADDLRTAFQLIVDRTDALTAFIAGYAELAKLPEPARGDHDFNVVVGGAARLFAGDAEQAGVELRVELAPDVPRARVDAGQVERVVINLVKNAVEAAPRGGEVRVATARRGSQVEVIVDDNGPGIALEARRHLFVPYFTTKPGGSGIGLALVRQIVLGHGGSVTAEDRPGGGTRARVLLPLTGGDA
jgi:signal transduction histidine kinase